MRNILSRNIRHPVTGIKRMIADACNTVPYNHGFNGIPVREPGRFRLIIIIHTAGAGKRQDTALQCPGDILTAGTGSGSFFRKFFRKNLPADACGQAYHQKTQNNLFHFYPLPFSQERCIPAIISVNLVAPLTGILAIITGSMKIIQNTG